MTTDTAPRAMGPLAQLVQQFIALQIDGRDAEAAEVRLRFESQMAASANHLANKRGIPEQRARLFAFLNALGQVMELCPDELIADRARFLHDNLVRDRYDPDPPRIRQHASRQAAARGGVGKNHRRN